MMVILAGLADELLVQIAECVEDTYDLYNLSLVSRSLRRASYDVILRTISLGPYTPNIKTVHDFCKGLAENPQLAICIRNLEIVFSTQYGPHYLSCATQGKEDEPKKVEECTCPLYVASTVNAGIMSRLASGNDTWRKNLCEAHQPALIGLIISLLPTLQSLDITAEHEENGDGSRRCPVIQIEHLFGTLPSGIGEIPGLHRLSHLKCFPLIPWALQLPQLRSLEFDVDSFNSEKDVRKSVLALPVTNMRVTHLKIGLEGDATEEIDHALSPDASKGTVLHYVNGFIKQMKSLQHLHIRLRSSRFLTQPYDRSEPNSYQSLFEAACPTTLQSFILDTHHLALGREGELQPVYALPIQSLRHLTDLRRIVAPQDALFGVCLGEDLDLEGFFPPTIETIEVIDSTLALNTWAQRLLQSRSSFPALKHVVLWSDHQSEILSEDADLDIGAEKVRALLSEEKAQEFLDAFDDEDWEQTFSVGLEIWDDLQKAGIEVDEMNREERGKWRLSPPR